MKLSGRRTAAHWDAYGFYQGRYKNFTIKINEGGSGWDRKVDHHYIMFYSDKYNKIFNSLWDGLKFDTIDEAKDYALEWVDAYLKEAAAK